MNDPIPHQETPSSVDNSKSVIVAASALSGLLFGGVILNFVAPLILWLIWKDQFPQINQTSKNVINSQISWAIWQIISGIICFILTFFIIGFLLIWIAPILWLIFTIIHVVKISDGDTNYEMPLTIKFF